MAAPARRRCPQPPRQAEALLLAANIRGCATAISKALINCPQDAPVLAAEHFDLERPKAGCGVTAPPQQAPATLPKRDLAERDFI